MKVLIIGGCGYIGSRLYQHLRIRHEVQTLDVEWFGNYANERNTTTDYRLINTNYLHGFDSVVLLAGHSSVPMCENMGPTFRNNVRNFVELLDKVRPDQKLIYASSSSVYNGHTEVPPTEKFFISPATCWYDLSKQQIDAYAELSDKQTYGLRFGTVNGWSPNLRTDIMINAMYDSYRSDGRIFFNNPKIHRPILGLHDLCRAVEAIVTGPDKRGLYNLASFNTTVEAIVAEMQTVLRDVETIQQASSVAYNFTMNTEKFQDEYNFKFQDTVSSIVHALREGWEMCEKSKRKSKDYV